MKIIEITKTESIDDSIKALKVRPSDAPKPDVELFKKRIDVKDHEVFDRAKRPDKTTYPESREIPGKDGAPPTIEKGSPKTELVNRIGLAIQSLIIKRAVSFLFGNPVILSYNAEADIEIEFTDAVKAVLEDVKEEMLNRKAARNVFSFTEVAEVWFPVDQKEEHDEYGFNTKFKLRSMLFTPDKNDLYPLFDETGDMIAFSRGYKMTENAKEVEYFETYTSEEFKKWRRSDTGWEELADQAYAINIGKIPVVYGRQEYMETEDVQSIIERLEKMFSNLGDTNDYHSAPKIFVNGKILSFGSKGQSNTVIQGEKEADAKYLSWDHAPESWKLEATELLKFAFMLTQTPDISFESVKGIGNLSGIALKLMFLDAHLKVKDKEEIFIPYLQRRYKIIRAFLFQMNNKFQQASKVRIKPQIDPYMIADELTAAQVLQIATGSKAFISQKEAVKQWGGDESDYDTILEEAKSANTEDIFGPNNV